jgi:hypothetical protein
MSENQRVDVMKLQGNQVRIEDVARPKTARYIVGERGIMGRSVISPVGYSKAGLLSSAQKAMEGSRLLE